MSVKNATRQVEIEDLVMTWDETVSNDDGSMEYEGDEAVTFSFTSADHEFSVDVSMYAKEGFVSMSRAEVVALRDFLNKALDD